MPVIDGQPPKEITKRAMQAGSLVVGDAVVLDTAGRLAKSMRPLMAELGSVHAEAKPIETLLVADSMTGQDAIITAEHLINV